MTIEKNWVMLTVFSKSPYRLILTAKMWQAVVLYNSIRLFTWNI